ncbi:MAG: recombinase family protein, partial [Candidatus Bipolaricaulia bacterium]
MVHLKGLERDCAMYVVLYVRASSERQADKGLSISAQLRELHAFCDRQGYVVLGEFKDDGYSGTTDQRPGFQEMVAFCKLHRDRIGAVVVWKNNRFSRDRVHAAVYKRYLRNMGVDVMSVTEPGVDSIDGEILEAVVEAADSRFSLSLSQDVMRGMREVAKRGFFPFSLPPMGYAKEPVQDGKATRYRLVPNEETAPLIRRIYEVYVGGAQGAKSVAISLNEEGLTTPTGKSWSTKGVLRILENPAYVGTLRLKFKTKSARFLNEGDRELVIEDAHPALIDRETYEKAQQLREMRMKTHPRVLGSDYLLSGLLRCSKCGRRMHGVSAKSGTQFYYVCSGLLESGKTVCATRYIRRARLDEAILEKVTDVLLEEENLRRLGAELNRELGDREGQIKRQRKLLAKELKNKESQVGRLVDAIESGELTAHAVRD